MKAQMLVLAGSLALAPLGYAQDHAVSRGGGDGGGGHTGGGGHPTTSSSSGGSSGGSSYSGGSSGSSGGSYSGGSYAPSSSAERRHPRAGTGRGGSGGGYSGGGQSWYYPGYGGSYYYPGWYGSYWWPYGSYGWYGGYWGGGGWGYPAGGSVYHYRVRESGSLRVLVDPPEARVYVDGYYAGVVDDYDGLFQRLNVSPGRHEITLKLEGYKSHRMKVYVAPDSTLKVRYDLEKGSGETFEDLAGPVTERELRRERERDRDRDREQERDDEDRLEMQDRSSRDEGGPTGRLKLSVRPGDASVYVDGAFRGTGREASRLTLPPGRHRVEVVRPGYRTIEKEIEVPQGETVELSIDLDKGTI